MQVAAAMVTVVFETAAEESVLAPLRTRTLKSRWRRVPPASTCGVEREFEYTFVLEVSLPVGGQVGEQHLEVILQSFRARTNVRAGGHQISEPITLKRILDVG